MIDVELFYELQVKKTPKSFCDIKIYIEFNKIFNFYFAINNIYNYVLV